MYTLFQIAGETFYRGRSIRTKEVHRVIQYLTVKKQEALNILEVEESLGKQLG